MTPRALFIIILKVFGIYTLLSFVLSIPQIISTLYPVQGYDNDGSSIFFSLFIVACLIAFFGVIIWLLIFKANMLSDKLKLEKGFDQEQLSANISATSVLLIALILAGGVLLAGEIPNFFRQVYLFINYRKEMTLFTPKGFDFSYMIVTVAKILIGLLLIGERHRIAELIQSKRKEKGMSNE